MTIRALHISIAKEWSRLRHRKGHGIHSPMAYSIVKEVFNNKDNVLTGNMQIGMSSENQFFSKKSWLEIQKLHAFCSSALMEIIYCDEADTVIGNGFYVLAGDLTEGAVTRYISEISEKEGVACIALALVRKYDSIHGEISSNTSVLSIERREYMFCCFRKGFSKQHFVL